MSNVSKSANQHRCNHWHRLVRNIGGKTKIRVVITDESISISQLLGACAQAAPKDYSYGAA